MTVEEEHEKFIALCGALIADLTRASEKGADPWIYPNVAGILRSSVESWRALARDRKLYHPLRQDFGASKADLDFGPFDARVRELETFYRRRIFEPMQRADRHPG